MAILTALAAALLYAVASILQHRSALAQPSHRSMTPSLLLRLANRPIWLLGMAADAGAYVCQFVALGHGSLVLVQPLLVTGLLIALPIGSALTHRHLTGREWASAALVVAGLALFLVLASPNTGKSDASPGVWAATTAASVGTALLMVALAGPSGGVRRACMLAVGAGLIVGLAAGFTKSAAHQLSLGLGHALANWQPYALVACAVLGLLLIQSAFQAGPLRWSLPMLTVVETVAGILIGATALGETINHTAQALFGESVGIVAMAAGVFGLGQAPLALD